MANTFSNLLKNIGQYLTLEGRDMAQNLRNISLASKVKRIEPEDYDNPDEYKKALQASQLAWREMNKELNAPTANAILNKLLSVSPEQQSRQTQAQLYGITKEKPTGMAVSPEMIKTTFNILSKTPLPGASSLLGAIAQGGAMAGAGGLGMSTPGEETKSVLTAIPFGMAGGAAAFGLSKLGESLASRVPKPKETKLAGKNATLEWGFKGKDIDKAGGWEEARKLATDLYDDAKTLGLPTNTRYDKANALKTITETLNADSDILVSAFDKTGTPATSVNQVINSIKNDPKISLALTKDPATAEWLYQTLSNYADDAGNLSMSAVKDAMSAIQSTAGGLKRVLGDQGPYTKQILSSGRSALRDVISNVSPEIDKVMGKLFDYINIEPSVLSQVVKRGKLPLPGSLQGINLGTTGAEIGDYLSSLLSGKGSVGGAPATTGFSQGLGNVLDILGQGVSKATGAIGGLVGNMPEQQPQPEELGELGEDDEGIQAIRSAFASNIESPEAQTSDTQQLNAINLFLVQGILNGQISASEANAVLNLLGMGQEEKTTQKSTGQTDAQNAMDSINRLQQSISSTNLTGPIKGLATISPFATEALDLQAQIDLARQVVGKFLEGGVLRKEDEEKYKKILPTMKDTQAVALRKLQNLATEIQNRINQYEYSGYSGYGESPYTAIDELGL